MRLVIVDDDSIIRRLLYATLSAAGHEVEQFSDGETALALLRREPIRLVITDWVMPSMDGGELIRRIRAIPSVPYTYIILLTTKSEKDDIVGGLEAGADDYLTKPFHAEELRARVRNGERIVALEARLQTQLAVTNAITTSLGEGIYTLDLEGRVTYINPAAERLLGWTASELEGANMHDMIHFQHADGTPIPVADCALLAVSRTGVLVRVDEVFTRRDGTIIHVECTSAPAMLYGRVSGTVVTFHDITDRKEVEQQLALLAHYDPLTGLPNRTLFNMLLLQALDLARRQTQILALLFIDLDGFKSVNDTLGHSIGDLLLQIVGDRLMQCVHPTDSVARLGGDEFVALLPNIRSVPNAVTVAERILGALAHPCILGNHTVEVSGSVGIGIFPYHGEDSESLLRCADAAMYAAKRAGKHRYAVFGERFKEGGA